VSVRGVLGRPVAIPERNPKHPIMQAIYGTLH
jgi:hypothetical protein